MWPLCNALSHTLILWLCLVRIWCYLTDNQKVPNIGTVFWVTIYPPLHSPLFTPSELPFPSSTITETENSQLFAAPPLTPTQNSQLPNPYPILSIPQPTSTITMMVHLTSYTMPMHNEHAAPTFNSFKPRELSRYFEDLEQLMRQAAIDTEEEKKQQVLMLCWLQHKTNLENILQIYRQQQNLQ